MQQGLLGEVPLTSLKNKKQHTVSFFVLESDVHV